MFVKQQNKKAFTLVELIVVITILAILATIGFVSMQGYAVSARESSRLSDIKVLEKALGLYVTRGNLLPLPDNHVTITASGTTVMHQGYAGTGALTQLRQASDIRDPILLTPYTYSVTANRQHFQILAHFEKNTLASLMPNQVKQSYAVTQAEMHPRVFGTEIGTLLNESTSLPIQENTFPGNTLEIFSNTDTYISYRSNSEIFTSTGSELIVGAVSQMVNTNGLLDTCKDIYDTHAISHGVNGKYTINIAGRPQEVYCNMTDESGGWTGFYGTNRPSVNVPTLAQVPGKVDFGTIGTNHWSVNLSGMSFSQLMVSTDNGTNTIFPLLGAAEVFNLIGETPYNAFDVSNITADEGDCKFFIRYRTHYGNPLWEVGINSQGNGALDASCANGVGGDIFGDNRLIGQGGNNVIFSLR